jgi:hypothetical protein
VRAFIVLLFYLHVHETCLRGLPLVSIFSSVARLLAYDSDCLVFSFVHTTNLFYFTSFYFDFVNCVFYLNCGLIIVLLFLCSFQLQLKNSKVQILNSVVTQQCLVVPVHHGLMTLIESSMVSKFCILSLFNLSPFYFFLLSIIFCFPFRPELKLQTLRCSSWLVPSYFSGVYPSY